MITNKNIEHDIYDFLKSNPEKLPQIVRHYKIIKKTFAENESILKINQRPLSDEAYSKDVTIDLSKFKSSDSIIKKLLSHRLVSHPKDNVVVIKIEESNLTDIPSISSILTESAKDENNNIIDEIVDNAISQINAAVASVIANIDYSNIFHTASINVKNEYRDEYLTSLNRNAYHKWKNVDELKKYVNDSNTSANERYKQKSLDSDFTVEETNRLNEVINSYESEKTDHMYVRMAPFTDEERTYEEWKDFLIERYMSIDDPEYFKLLYSVYPIALHNVKEASELPTYSDIIVYGNKKYDILKKLEN